MKIGIYGGTFNPFHLAHKKMAVLFIEGFGLDKCLIVPAYQSPFKDVDNSIDKQHIINMIRLSINDNSKLGIETYELNKSRTSFTIDTINYLRSINPDDELNLLIGTDQFLSFEKWKDWEIILKKVNLVIANRKDGNNTDLRAIAENYRTNYMASINFLNNDIIQISASNIRDSIKLNSDISDLVTIDVAEYIYKNNLYRSATII